MCVDARKITRLRMDYSDRVRSFAITSQMWRRAGLGLFSCDAWNVIITSSIIQRSFACKQRAAATRTVFILCSSLCACMYMFVCGWRWLVGKCANVITYICYMLDGRTFVQSTKNEELLPRINIEHMLSDHEAPT